MDTLYKKYLAFIVFTVISITSIAQTENNEVQQKLNIRSEQLFRNSINRRPAYIQYNFVNPVYNPYRTFTHTPLPPKERELSLFSIGLTSSYSYNQPVTLGAYFTIKGDDLMFLLNIETSSSPNIPYYDNIANQYIEYWNDEFLGVQNRVTDIGFGLGKNICNKYFPYLHFSAINYREYVMYFDETYVLSSTGKYSIPGSYYTDVNFGVGLLYQISVIELKTELDIIGRSRINLGIGIQL